MRKRWLSMTQHLTQAKINLRQAIKDCPTIFGKERIRRVLEETEEILAAVQTQPIEDLPSEPPPKEKR